MKAPPRPSTSSSTGCTAPATFARCDTMTNLNRSVERRALREFAMRVAFQMSAEDSANLVDTPAASKLGQYRALFYSEDEGRMEKFRPYGLPSERWLDEAAHYLSSRAALRVI